MHALPGRWSGPAPGAQQPLRVETGADEWTPVSDLRPAPAPATCAWRCDRFFSVHSQGCRRMAVNRVVLPGFFPADAVRGDSAASEGFVPPEDERRAAGPLSRPCAPAGTEHSPPEQHGIDLFIPSRGEDGTRPPARRGGFPGAPHRPRGQWRSAALRDARRSLTTRFRFTDPCRARTSTGRCRVPSTRR
jgi:hypothetical protein